ncbi:MAG: hypothetical protein CMK23_07550 [Porticoccaceae bacterium]|nr:hypothetical protein [Porticoccaceae bacterium]
MAITITPTGRTGMNVGLSDIASILSEQNQVLAQTAVSQEKLTSAFKDYLTMLAGNQMDDLQDERRAEAESRSEGGRGMSGIANAFSMSGVVGGVGSYIAGFAKRLLPVALGLLFGDELLEGIKSAVKNYLDRDISSDVFDAVKLAVVGGLGGFLFGGLSGGLYGMLFGVMFSPMVRQKIADGLSLIIGKEIDSTDPSTFVTAGAIALLLPAAIKAALPKLLSFLFSPTGLLVVAAGLTATAAYKYYTDDEFRAEIDKKTQPFRDAMIDAEKAFTNKVGEFITTYTNEFKKAVNKAVGKNIFTTTEMEKRGEASLSEADRAEVARLREQQSIAREDYESYMAGRNRDEIAEKYGLRTTGMMRHSQNATALASMVTGYQDDIDAIVDPAADIQRMIAGKSNQEIADLRKNLADNLSALSSVEGSEKEAAVLRRQIAALDKAIASKQSRQPSVGPPTGIPSIDRPPTGPNADIMAQYGSRSTGNVVAPVDASNTNIVTNNSSSPLVLPAGGSQDSNDNARSRMLPTSNPHN